MEQCLFDGDGLCGRPSGYRKGCRGEACKTWKRDSNAKERGTSRQPPRTARTLPQKSAQPRTRQAAGGPQARAQPPQRPPETPAPSTALAIRPPSPEPVPEPARQEVRWTAEVISSRPNVPDPPEPEAAGAGTLAEAFARARQQIDKLNAGGRIPLSRTGGVSPGRPARPGPEPPRFLALGHAPGYRPDGPQLPARPRREPVAAHDRGFAQQAREMSADARKAALPSTELVLRRVKSPLAAEPRTGKFLCPHGGLTVATLARLGGSVGSADFICESCSRVPATC